ncbi:MAG TPA: RHS repeat-associated core domain-containing protein [Cellvibrionaceae bacterium]
MQGPNPEVFLHDPAGNLLANTASAPEGQKAPGNRLNLFGDAHFHYDAAGNRTQQARGKQGALKTHYQYNSLNQLTAIAVNGVITKYAYDPLGRRISKRSADKSCEFLWLGDQLLSERTAINGAEGVSSAKTYLFKPNSFEPIAFVQNDGIYYYHLDHLGTPQEITNQQGELVWAVSYKAYGNLAVAFKAEVENNLRFAGQYFDEESGLHYNRFRYYDPACGRFINQDPIGLLGGVNNYLYVPNPTGWVDPLGLSCKNEGLGDSSTSPWLSDKRAGVVSHLESFRDGASYLIPKGAYERFVVGKPLVGDPSGQFMTTRTYMDKLIADSGGDVNFIKDKLGIPAPYWNEELYRIDVHNPLLHNARMPSGFERGANEKFVWGGHTSGGMPEIVTDAIPGNMVTMRTTGIKPK